MDNYEMKFHPKGEYLSVKLKGAVNLKQAKMLVKNIIAGSLEHSCDRILQPRDVESN